MTVSTKLTPDQTYRASEVAKILGVSIATFYRLPWFKARKFRPSPRAVRYLSSDVALYQSLHRGQ